jgi:hypothetical protein
VVLPHDRAPGGHAAPGAVPGFTLVCDKRTGKLGRVNLAGLAAPGYVLECISRTDLRPGVRRAGRSAAEPGTDAALDKRTPTTSGKNSMRLRRPLTWTASWPR